MKKKIFYNSEAGIVQTGEQIGAGGEGIVYEVQGRSDLAAKIYHKPLSEERAEKLLALARLGSGRLFKLAAWPTDVLRSDPDGRAGEKVVGVLMKRINEGREVHTLHSPRSRLQSFPEASWSFLIYVAANIVRAISIIHEHGFVIGDVNPKNILVTRKATVFLLDCDSFQVTTGGRSYRCEGGFPEYTPPELQGRAFGEVDREPEHDYFGLAVAIFQLLFLGRHPFSGIYLEDGEMPLEKAIREYRFAYGADAESRRMKPPPGALALESIPDSVADRFRRAFLAATAAERPTPQEWLGPLESLAKSLKKCSLHSGHHYYQELPQCPWCAIETGARIRLFNFQLNGNQGGHFKLDKVWEEIAAINPPSPPPLVREIPPGYLQPTELGYKAMREKSEDKLIALVVAALAGFIVGWGTASLMLLIIAAVGVIKLARGNSLLSLQFIFTNAKSLTPTAQKIQTVMREADNRVRQLEKRWKEEATEERFINKFAELRDQKEAYEKLSRIRQYRLNTLEAKGIGATQRVRIAVDREVDDLRHRLEYELNTGPFYLNRVKCEIEDMRRRLLPSLLNEKESLALAAKDWEVASKRNGLMLVLFILFISFLGGLSVRHTIERHRPITGPPMHSGVVYQETKDGNPLLLAAPILSPEVKDLYKWGVDLIAQENFQHAIVALRQVVMKDPSVHEAWQQLGFAYYRLGNYPEALDAAKEANSIAKSFGSKYVMGLVYAEQKKWSPASDALSIAVSYCDASNWNGSCTTAYDTLAHSLVSMGSGGETIADLERGLETNPKSYDRFKLASLYLWYGNIAAAEKQSQLLRGKNQKLAQELDKLIKSHQDDPVYVTTKNT